MSKGFPSPLHNVASFFIGALVVAFVALLLKSRIGDLPWYEFLLACLFCFPVGAMILSVAAWSAAKLRHGNAGETERQ